MDYVGGASGAALGYILGNVPGAYVGYYAGKKLTQKSMKRKFSVVGGPRRPGIKRMRVNRAGVHVGSGGGFGIRTKHFVGYRKKRVPFYRKTRYYKNSVAKIQHSASLRKPMLRIIRKKGLRQRRGPPVRYSKKFAKKVRKIILANRPRSFTIHTVFDSFNGQPLQNKQAVNTIPANIVYGGYYRDSTLATNSVTRTTCENLFFSPAWFLQQASLSWNGMAQPNTQLAGATTVGLRTLTVDINSVGMLPWRGTKFPVIKSWARLCFRNNSQRTLYVDVFNCKPKFKGTTLEPQQETCVSAALDWQRACVQSSASDIGTKLSTVTSYTNPDSDGSHAKFNTSHLTYKEDPRHNPWWSSRWKAEVTKLVLEPGQCTPVIIKGPSDMMLDYSKFGTAVTYSASGGGLANTDLLDFQDIQPFSRSVFIRYHHEMTSYKHTNAGGTDPVTTGYYCGLAPSGGGSVDAELLLLETSVYTKIGMPDEILRTTESAYRASTTILANQRVDKYGNYVYDQGPPDGLADTLVVNTAGVTAITSR